MQTIKGNIWDFYKPELNNWLVITTNTQVKNNGEAVLGKGIALEANNRFRWLADDYGYFLTYTKGDKSDPFFDYERKLVLFPTKIHWRDDSSLDLIGKNCKILVNRIFELDLENNQTSVYLPALGCGNGNLDWNDVEKVISPILPDNFIVVLR